MKRFFACLTILALLICQLCSGFCEAVDAQMEVIYFYENYCESCAPEEDFIEYFRSLTGVSLTGCDYRAYNVARSSGQTALAEAEALYELENVNIPMVIVDGTAYCGASQMESALAEDALSWGGTTDSCIVLLTVPMCENCVRAGKTLKTLPETVLLKRGNLEIESKVMVETIDISAQPEIAARLFDAYAVPDEQRIAPSVFYADRYLSGIEAIEKSLAAEVALGWAAGGVLLPPAED